MQPSEYSVSETIDRLEAILKEKGVKIFARFDHGAEAQHVDLELKPTQVLVFGDPKVGTFLMQDDPFVALELPLKVMATEVEGQTVVSYQNMSSLPGNFQIHEHMPVIGKISEFLDNIVKQATQGA